MGGAIGMISSLHHGPADIPIRKVDSIMTLADKIISIIVVNFAIAVIIRLGLSFLPQLQRRDLHGVYAILLPLGFALFGWDIPYWMTTAFVVLGLVELAYNLRKTLRTLSQGAA